MSDNATSVGHDSGRRYLSPVTPLQLYIDGWISNDADAIAAAVTDDCIITECYGPVYRSRERVHQWATTWFAAGGVVHAWALTDHFTTSNREAAQWVFEYTWQGTRDTIEGSTIVTMSGGLVDSAREYQTTATRYDWSGVWR